MWKSWRNHFKDIKAIWEKNTTRMNVSPPPPPYHEFFQCLVSFPPELTVVLPFLAQWTTLTSVNMNTSWVESRAFGLNAQRALFSAKARASRGAWSKLLPNSINKATFIHTAFSTVVWISIFLWRFRGCTSNNIQGRGIFSSWKLLLSAAIHLLSGLQTPEFTACCLASQCLFLFSPRFLIRVSSVTFALPVSRALLPPIPAHFIRFPWPCLVLVLVLSGCCVVPLYLAGFYILFVLSFGHFLQRCSGATQGNHQAAGHEEGTRESPNCHGSGAGHHLLHPRRAGHASFTSKGITLSSCSPWEESS